MATLGLAIDLVDHGLQSKDPSNFEASSYQAAEFLFDPVVSTELDQMAEPLIRFIRFAFVGHPLHFSDLQSN